MLKKEQVAQIFVPPALKFLQKNTGLFVTFMRKYHQVWCDVFDNLTELPGTGQQQIFGNIV